jgi:hypothetical protein
MATSSGCPDRVSARRRGRGACSAPALERVAAGDDLEVARFAQEALGLLRK